MHCIDISNLCKQATQLSYKMFHFKNQDGYYIIKILSYPKNFSFPNGNQLESYIE